MKGRRLVASVAFAAASAAFGAQTPGPAAPRVSGPATTPTLKSTSGALEVLVTDPAGRPAAGAFVLVLPVQGALEPVTLGSTRTDQEGRAKLQPQAPGPWNVFVHARGFVTQRLARVTAGPLRVRLETGGSISGVVRDARRKQPVARARVYVRTPIPRARGFDEEAARDETATDARGRFRFDGIGREPVTVSVRAPGFDEAGREARAGQEVEVFLFPGASLAGTVRDDDGRPVLAALVVAESDRRGSVPPGERTDARGEFMIPGVKPGGYTVTARVAGRAPGVAAIAVEAESEARVSIVVSEGGFATGRVVDTEGRPLVARLRVEAVEGQGLPRSASDLMATDASADGSFAIGPLPIGTLAIGVSAPRRAPRSIDAAISRRGSVDLGDVVLETGLAIRGRVRQKQGEGIEGASVRARLRSPGERVEADALSGGDGTYVLAGLKPGTYDVTGSRPGFASARASAPAGGGDPIDLVLESGGEIAGRVLDADGQPLDGAWLEARRADESELVAPSGGSADEGDGRFVLRDLAAGRYVLQARATGRGEASLAEVLVAAGKRTDAGTLRLGGGGVVRGVVVDAEGEGVPGATVSAERDPTFATGEHVDQTRSSGAFEIHGVPVGRVGVAASHPSYAASKASIVEVDSEKESAPVRLVLLAGARVEGRAQHRDGRPFARGQVRATSLEPGAEGTWRDPSPVGADGGFAMDHLPSGRTRVDLLVATAPGTLAGLASREVVLREGETTTLDFALRDVLIAGSVTRAGQPLGGVRVRVRGLESSGIVYQSSSTVGAFEPTAGPPFLWATSREDGRYELVVFTPGSARVDLDSVARSERYPGRSVEVPDVDRFELDLEVGEAMVSGVVIDKGSGDPVANAWVRLRGAAVRTGADGSFSLSATTGEQQLSVAAEGRKRVQLSLDVGPEGLADLRVELERGLALRGRVLGSGGRPAGGVPVVLVDAAGEMDDYVETLADGSFRFDGLGAEPTTVVAGGDLPGWAVRAGLVPGDEPVSLPLRPGGRIAVRVRSPDGRPIKGEYPEVRRVGGVVVALSGGSATTDPSGFVEIGSPAGLVEVEAGPRGNPGRGAVTVQPGAVVPLDIAVPAAPKPKETEHR